MSIWKKAAPAGDVFGTSFPVAKPEGSCSDDVEEPGIVRYVPSQVELLVSAMMKKMAFAVSIVSCVEVTVVVTVVFEITVTAGCIPASALAVIAAPVAAVEVGAYMQWQPEERADLANWLRGGGTWYLRGTGISSLVPTTTFRLWTGADAVH